MRRVALVCEPTDGGAAEHVVQLALGLPEHGYEPTVFCASGFKQAEHLAAAGCDVALLPFRRDFAHPQDDVRAFASLVRRVRDFDLVHAHAAKAGVVARAAAAVRHRPAVYTPHCFPFVGEISPARRRFSLAVERALAPLTQALVCVCEAERTLASARRVEPRGSLAVVLNGCPACGDVEPDPELAGLRARGPLVGSVTVLRPQKQLDVLLAAAPRMLEALPDLTIAIVGDGVERPRLRRLARVCGSRVTFVPFRPPAARALRCLDLYLLPSAWEALPIGLLEALACGVPQVASDVGGNREAVSPETGVLVPAGDAEALAAAVVELMQDPERRTAMSVASRRRHAERFGVRRMVAQTAAVYDAVLQ